MPSRKTTERRLYSGTGGGDRRSPNGRFAEAKREIALGVAASEKRAGMGQAAGRAHQDCRPHCGRSTEG
jgi:hypothetical protein